MKKITLFIIYSLLLPCMGNLALAQRITVTWAGTGIGGFTTDGMGGYMTQASIPHDVCLDAANNVYYTDPGNGLVRKISAIDGTVTTIGGGGISTADGILATSALLNPYFMCMDASGNLYFTNNNQIKTINATTGIVTTVAGTGTRGFSGDGGLAISATLNGPAGICIDASNNLYVVDSGNNRVRKITAATGFISTIAGTGFGAYSGDGGAATAATLHEPTVICINATGDVYVADQCFLWDSSASGMFIRKIDATTGIITTIAGSHTFSLDHLFGVRSEDCFLGHITGMCCDHDGNVYCNEISCSCREIDVHRDSVYAVGGNFEIESFADGLNSLIAYMNYPYGLCADATGNLYVADALNNRIRKIIQLTHAPSFAYRVGQVIYPCSGVAVNINNMCAMTVIDSAQTETWTVLAPPANGTLSGFPYTRLSVGTGSLTIPSGLTYTSTTGYTGLDAFQVVVSNGINADTMTLYVNVGATSPIAITTENVCAGAAAFIAASSESGTFSLTNGHATVTGTSIYGVSAGIDTAIFTSPGVCSASAYFTVNALPNAGTITGATAVCTGTPITLSDAVTGGAWSATSVYATIDSVSGVVTAISAGTATIAYLVSNAFCSASAYYSLSVGLPVVSVSGPAYICTGATPFTATLSGGTWSITNSNATLTSSGTTATVSGVIPGTDTLLYSVSNTCGTAAIPSIFTVDTGNSGTLTAPTTVCTGAEYALSSTMAGGTFTVTNADAYMRLGTNIIGYNTGVDSVSYTIASGICPSIAVFTVVGSPSAGLVSGPATVCTGSPVTFTDGVTGGWWTTSTSSIATVDSATGLVIGLTPGTAYVFYNFTDGVCTSNAPYTFTVSVSPDAGIIIGISTEYTSHSTLLTDTASGGIWSTTNAAITTVSGSGSVYGVAAGMDTIIYSVTSGGCTTKAYFAFTVTDSTTGFSTIATNNNNMLTIVPNPASEHFTINVVSSYNEPITITIMNMAGQVIKQIAATTNQPIDGYMDAPTGIYMISATGDHLKLSSKVVKE